MAGVKELPSKVFFFFFCIPLFVGSWWKVHYFLNSGSSGETWESFHENDQTDFAFQRCFRWTMPFGYRLFTFSSVSIVKVREWLQDYRAVSLQFSDTCKDKSKASMCDTNMFRVCTFPFVFSDLCIDGTVTECSRAWDWRWPLHLVSAWPSDLSGQACWVHLYLLCLLSIPIIHHPSTRPQGSPPVNPRPQSRDSVPSVCQRGYYFSAPEI